MKVAECHLKKLDTDTLLLPIQLKNYIEFSPEVKGRYSDVHENAKKELEARGFDLSQCTNFY